LSTRVLRPAIIREQCPDDECLIKGTPKLVARDRDHPGRYFSLVFFDSYESAMENSGLPETMAAAERYMELADGPATFYNLDVLADRP
jgi:hypothetical protein